MGFLKQNKNLLLILLVVCFLMCLGDGQREGFKKIDVIGEAYNAKKSNPELFAYAEKNKCKGQGGLCIRNCLTRHKGKPDKIKLCQKRKRRCFNKCGRKMAKAAKAGGVAAGEEAGKGVKVAKAAVKKEVAAIGGNKGDTKEVVQGVVDGAKKEAVEKFTEGFEEGFISGYLG